LAEKQTPSTQPASAREWDAHVYHKLSEPQVSWGRKVLARLRLRGDETVMDAGCGTGRLTGELLAALPGGRVVGIDLSQQMLRKAREHLRAHVNGRVSLVACDLLDLPFRCVFDGIVSTAAFHWVLNHDLLFANLHSQLRPGGWLVAQCGGGPNLEALRQRVGALIGTPKFREFFSGFCEPWLYQTAEEAAETLRRAGFSKVLTSVEAAPTVLDNAQQYTEFISNVILQRHLALLPEENLRAAFIGNLVEQAAGETPPFLLDYWRLNLSATAS
jgi:trans-aconitate 2-methyltransferase